MKTMMWIAIVFFLLLMSAFSLAQEEIFIAHSETIEATHGLNGATPNGVRFGVSVSRYEPGFSMVTGSDGIMMAPTLNLAYLPSSGVGLDFSVSYLTEDAYYSFSGIAATGGVVYRVPKTALLIKGGLSHFRGQDGDGGTSKASGPSLGIGTMLRINNHLGLRVDLSGHHLRRFPGTSFGLGLGFGITFLPKPQ